jgi:hypothetical protein
MENNIPVITEVSDSIFHFNRTSIYTFIKTHPSYSGKMYLLINDKYPISQRNLQSIYSIYENIELVNVLVDQEYNDLYTKLSKCKIDLEKVNYDLVKFVSFKLGLPEFLYFSNNTLFLKPIFGDLINYGLTMYSDVDSNIMSNIIYNNGTINDLFIQGIFKSILKGNSKNPLTSTKVISTIFKNEPVNLIMENTVFNSNDLTNDVYKKYTASLLLAKAIIFDDLSSGIKTKTFINSLWIKNNKDAASYLSRPINTKLKKNILIERDRLKLNIPRKTEYTLMQEYCESLLTSETYHLNKDKKIKLAIVTGIWKRPDVFEYFAKGVKELEKLEDFEITTIISGSEGEKSKKLVEKYGFEYIEIENSPLSTKMNAPVKVAKSLGVDYVLCMGSDDILHPDVLIEYLKYMRAGIDYIGVTDFYFYDTDSRHSAYWGGYREAYRLNHTCGAGRTLSANLLDKWGWEIWQPYKDTLLDTSMQQKLEVTEHTSVYFSLKAKGLYGLDIKSTINMTPFTLWDNTNYINTSELQNKFDYLGLK